MIPRCQLPGCTRAAYGMLGQDYCSASHKFTHHAEQEIVAYLRDGKRIGGKNDTRLMAVVLSDYIERGEHR